MTNVTRYLSFKLTVQEGAQIFQRTQSLIFDSQHSIKEVEMKVDM